MDTKPSQKSHYLGSAATLGDDELAACDDRGLRSYRSDVSMPPLGADANRWTKSESNQEKPRKAASTRRAEIRSRQWREPDRGAAKSGFPTTGHFRWRFLAAKYSTLSDLPKHNRNKQPNSSGSGYYRDCIVIRESSPTKRCKREKPATA